MMTFVELEQVEKVYHQPDQKIVALQPLSLSVEAGEFVVITGESGAGKSTLISLIGALDRPTGGRVSVAGCDLTTMRAAALAEFRLLNIGFVFQDFCLVRHLTALGNVHLPLFFSGRRNSTGRAEAVLRRFEMGHRLHQRPADLSRGEQQRVALARALVNEPRLLLADEPTANLDARNARIVWDHFAELNRDGGLTIIAVTHSHDVARGVGRVITLDNGAVVEDRRIQNDPDN